MDEKQLQALANELAKNLKTPEDLSQFDRLLKKISVEAALNAEMSHHLGYDKNQPKPGANSRNGYSTKTVIIGDGPLELRTPRDRDGSFEPQLVKKNQTRITGMDQLQALANELAKNLKTPEDLSQFDRLLKKISVEAALNAEMSHHLGYDKNQPKPGANSRNGYSTKTVIIGDGPLELRTPRDRDGSFEPQLVKKNQTRITGMDNQILSLYAKGLTTVSVQPEPSGQNLTN